MWVGYGVGIVLMCWFGIWDVFEVWIDVGWVYDDYGDVWFEVLECFGVMFDFYFVLIFLWCSFIVCGFLVVVCVV